MRDIKSNVIAVEAYVGDGLLAKAVAQVRSGLRISNGPGAMEALRALMPPGAGLVTEGVAETIGPEFGGKLLEAPVKAISRFPRKSSPGRNGSRIEHWGRACS